jgi:hypothetical protein
MDSPGGGYHIQSTGQGGHCPVCGARLVW